MQRGTTITEPVAAHRPAGPCADRPVLRRLMLPLAGALIVLVAGFGAVMLWHQKRHLDEVIASSISAIPADFSRVLDLQADTLRTALRFIADSPDLRAALKARDRQRLLLGYRTLFDTLHQEQGVTHFYFHGPDRVNLLRLHRPKKWGDVIDRFTTCEAQRTGKTAAGIELGPLGTFSLRAVEPVFDDEGLIGFVELGKEIAGVLEWLASRRQIDIAVVVRKSLLNRQEWQASMAALGREADWDRFPDDVLIYNSLTQFPTAIDPYVNEDDLADTDTKLELTFGGTSRRVAFLPLRDVSGSEVGHFIALCDVSSQRQAFARLLCITGAGCLLLLALLLAFFYVVLRNTDRGIEARALALQEEILFRKAVIANAAEGLCVCHGTGDARLLTFTVWNERMREITGYTMAEINHLGWHQLMPRDTHGLAQSVARIERMEMGEEVRDEEWTVIRRDGQKRTLLISTSFLVSNGSQTHILALVQDITERKQLEECVQNQLQLLQTLMDAIPYPVYYKDAELRYLGCNRAFGEMFGASEGQLIGKTIYDIASKDLADRYHTADQELLARPGSQTYEGSLESVDGVRHQMLFRKATFQNSEGGVGGIVGVAVDTTELARAEERVRETMELKSQFISTVCHELSTALAAMKEAVIVVADGIAGRLNKGQTRFLDIARRNIDRLARLIDDVLDFQKLSAGEMEFHRQSNDIRKTIDDAYNTMLPQAQQKQLQLSLDLEPNLPSFVYDHDRMVQVLTNLLSNAIKFTPEAGRIVLGARRRGESLALSVSDTGMGIPEEALPKIFTQLDRVCRPGKEIQGTGLGLAIVNGIVAAHGGRIDVESEVDQGTTFTVVLPLPPRQPADDMSPKAMPAWKTP